MAQNIFLKKIRRDIAYFFIINIIFIFRFLPRKSALKIGSVMGFFLSFLAVKEYRDAVENLKTAFGNEKDEKEIKKIARNVFRHMVMNFADTAKIITMTPESLRETCVPNNLEPLIKSLEKGCGLILLSAHVGCWEVMGSYVALEGLPLNALSRRLYDLRLENLIIKTREKFGMVNISSKFETKAILNVLKTNKILIVLIDQDIKKAKGIFVDFFGKPAYTVVSPAVLALKHGTPIIPLFTYRDADNRHNIMISDEILYKPTDDRDKDIYEIISQCTKAIENFIREHPEQWVWFTKDGKQKRKMLLIIKKNFTYRGCFN
jgi:Kdo2-lipid IVA lauroyltransferase/acyltransferase